ncbi:MAG TPA: pepsin/retropepsin-like aspartic protease family protein [Rhizomicrobium sp.]|nr:pepsin/retropepsin-like aspartic protease family protein [Rhizomicrobium sp.]
MRASTIAFTAWAAVLAAANTAQAADCKPLGLVSSVALEPMDRDDRFTVPVTIDGHAEHLIVDSGSPFTMLSLDAAKRLDLKMRGNLIGSVSVTGKSSNAQAIANTFDLGSAHATNFYFFIYAGQLKEGEAGLVSPTSFSQSDIDFDFGGRRLNIFSRDHCEGRVIYWPERPLAVIPMDTRSGHLDVPVSVDGHALNAVLDTGATDTMLIDTAAWRIMGIKAGSADAPEIGASSADPLLKYYSHPFASLSFGGVNVQNPRIIIMTDRMSDSLHQSTGGGSRIAEPDNTHVPDIIIGMNILKSLHLYAAYGEKKLYITPAGTSSALDKPAGPASPAK